MTAPKSTPRRTAAKRVAPQAARTPEDEAFDRAQAAHAAANHLRQYRYSGHGLFLWRAFTDFRSRNVPVPETILAELDRFALALEKANDRASVLKAIHHAAPNGRAWAAPRAHEFDREMLALARVQEAIDQRALLKSYLADGLPLSGDARAAARETNDAIFKRVSKQFEGKPTWKSLKEQHYKWTKRGWGGRAAPNPLAASDDIIHILARASQNRP